ncbi:MAG: hypothetical protein JXR34_05130, partial [Bacteroidales bacterium]|nr:hypothetical protein [Bacteroidales bacterium]
GNFSSPPATTRNASSAKPILSPPLPHESFRVVSIKLNLKESKNISLYSFLVNTSNRSITAKLTK